MQRRRLEAIKLWKTNNKLLREARAHPITFKRFTLPRHNFTPVSVLSFCSIFVSPFPVGFVRAHIYICTFAVVFMPLWRVPLFIIFVYCRQFFNIAIACKMAWHDGPCQETERPKEKQKNCPVSGYRCNYEQLSVSDIIYKQLVLNILQAMRK